MARNIYQADPADLRRTLNRAEVQAILESKGRGFVKDRHKVMHFVERVKLTLEEAARRQHDLDATNMDLKAQIAARTGYASSMDPELALQYVEPSVLARYGDHAAQQLANAAETTRRRYEARTAALRDRIIDALESGEAGSVRRLLEDLLALMDE